MHHLKLISIKSALWNSRRGTHRTDDGEAFIEGAQYFKASHMRNQPFNNRLITHSLGVCYVDMYPLWKKKHSSILSLIIRLFYVIIDRMWNSHFLPKTDIDGRKRAQNTNTRVCFRIEWRTNWCKNLIFSNKRSELKTKIEISKPKLKERNNSRRRHMMSYEDKGGTIESQPFFAIANGH